MAAWTTSTDAAGAVVWRESYGLFGDRPKKPAAADNVGRVWQKRGKQQDDASGFVDLRRAVVRPGNWPLHGDDPVGFDDGNPHSFNRYGYANNEPYKCVDPDGRLPMLAYAAVVYAPHTAAAAGAGFAGSRAAGMLGPWTVTTFNIAVRVANSPTAHAVVEGVAGIASGAAGPTSTVSSVGGVSQAGLKSVVTSLPGLSRPDLIRTLESLGLAKCVSKNGRFLHFKDKAGNIQARIDPADENPLHDHLHLYDATGNSLNRNLDMVPSNSPDAHIEIK